MAGYQECRAHEVLLLAQAQQEHADEQTQKQRGDHALPLPTGHRLWFVRPAQPGERGM